MFVGQTNICACPWGGQRGGQRKKQRGWRGLQGVREQGGVGVLGGNATVQVTLHACTTAQNPNTALPHLLTLQPYRSEAGVVQGSTVLRTRFNPREKSTMQSAATGLCCSSR